MTRSVHKNTGKQHICSRHRQNILQTKNVYFISIWLHKHTDIFCFLATLLAGAIKTLFIQIYTLCSFKSSVLNHEHLQNFI